MYFAPLPPSLPARDGDRLLVRRLQAADLDALVDYRSDETVARYQSWPPTWSLDDARELLAADEEREALTPGAWVQWVLEDRATGEVCGDLGLHIVEHAPRTVELGVTIARAHQRRGIASEGLRILLRWLLAEHNLHRAYAQLDERNVAVRALFDKLGFREEAVHRDADWCKGEWTTLMVVAALRDELLQSLAPAS